MKQALALIGIALLVSCASAPATSSNAPALDLVMNQVGVPTTDTFYFRGPIGLQYDLAIKNPTNDQYTLRRLDIQSMGPGAYRVRTGSQPINQKVNPNGTTTVHVATWGQATGGFISSGEPVTLRVIAQFDGPHGRFQKIFTENLSQFGQ